MTEAESLTIEFIKDNFGNFYNRQLNGKNYIITNTILKPGDVLIFKVHAAVEAKNNSYCFKIGLDGHEHCQNESLKEFIITEKHIKNSIAVYIKIRNKTELVSGKSYQNIVEFRYTVLPLKVFHEE